MRGGTVFAVSEHMTQPRLILPGTTYLVTRNTLGGRHLFRPDSHINRVFMYCLFACARQLDIEVHAAVLMSTHEHLVVTDPTGRISVFLCRFHRLVAKCTQVLRGWKENVWEHRDCSVVALLSPQAVLREMAYTMANPAKDHLVTRAKEWPGVHTRLRDLKGRTISVRKPDAYFRRQNKRYPVALNASFSLPRVLVEHYGKQGAIDAIATQVSRFEMEAARQRLSRGTRVLGANAAQRSSPYRCTVGSRPARGRNPHFAVGTGQARLFAWAAARLKAFRRAYRKAYDRWKQGEHSQLFPAGTFWMKYAHSAVVAT